MADRRTGEPSSSLADLLSFLHPSPDDTTLLRACLLEDERGSTAFAAWSRSGAAAEVLPYHRNRLFPLLAEAARRFDAALEPTVRLHLRAALASEEVRYAAYLDVLRPALGALVEEGIQLIVLKGAALAETVYPRPQLRHSHDADLLLAADQQKRALSILLAHGWSLAVAPAPAASRTLIHRNGLPLCLHTRLIRGSLHPIEFPVLRGRACALEVAGVKVMRLSPADALLHILGQAVTSGGFASLQWACDAYFCVERGEEIDWNLLTESLAASELSPAYCGLLLDLSKALDISLPEAVCGALDQAPRAVSWKQREALVAALALGGFGFRKIWRGGSVTWRTRAALLKWFLAPEARLATAVAPETPRWRLPLRNLRRAASRFRL
jgi:hypothetical protein